MLLCSNDHYTYTSHNCPDAYKKVLIMYQFSVLHMCRLVLLLHPCFVVSMVARTVKMVVLFKNIHLIQYNFFNDMKTSSFDAVNV